MRADVESVALAVETMRALDGATRSGRRPRPNASLRPKGEPARARIQTEHWSGRELFYEQRAACRPRETRRFYQQLVRHYYSFLIPEAANVLELGCGLGDLLAELRPAKGVGVDFSPSTLALARQRHPDLEFHAADATRWTPSPVGEAVESADARRNGAEAGTRSFDYIVMADLINDVPDVQALFEHAHELANARTRLALNFLNTVWRPVLAVAERLGAKAPSLLQNWLSTADVRNLLHLAGWEVIKEEHRILWPIRTAVLAGFLNRWVAPLLPDCCLTIFLVARPRPNSFGAALQLTATHPEQDPEYTCSIIIPARNEAGNIEAAVRRTPELGLGTELIFVEGHSQDNTWAEIQRVQASFPERRIIALKQKGNGKGSAVREGFAAARGELLFILDADLTMPPELLPRFYDVARRGVGECINGVRLVYPMEHEAMRFLNMIANKFFGRAFSWLLGQELKDTLCGTKVIFRSDYLRLAQNRRYFGEFDPFGDFYLLFGAAKLNLKLIDLPIRYAARTYGETNIHRWSHGWLLLRMVLFAARRLKFV